MNTKLRPSPTLWMAFAVFAGIALLLQTVSVLTDYEAATDYFRRGAVLPTIACISALLAVACGTAAAILSKENLASSPYTEDRPHFPFSAIGYLIAGIGLTAIGKDVPALLAEAQKEQNTTPSLLALLAGISFLIAAVFAILTAFPQCRRYGNVLSTVGFFAVFGTILVNAYYYFDMTVEMNAPLKVAVQIGLLCVMLGITGELRYLLKIPMPRTYRMLLSWTLSAGALSSLPVLVAYLSGKMIRADYLFGALLILFYTIEAALSLCRLLCRSNENDRPDEPLPTDTAEGGIKE